MSITAIQEFIRKQVSRQLCQISAQLSAASSSPAPANIVTDAATYPLGVESRTSFYTFTGTTSTFTLPPVAGNTGVFIRIINDGSGTVTLNSNTGSNDIFDAGTKKATVPIDPGEVYVFYNNSRHYVIIP